MLCHETGRSYWPAESYTHAQLSSISLRPFGPVALPCPGQPELYLTATYGPDWASTGATHIMDHLTDSWQQATEFRLRPDMYRPALPLA
jgi:hypothetical protein